MNLAKPFPPLSLSFIIVAAISSSLSVEGYSPPCYSPPDPLSTMQQAPYNLIHELISWAHGKRENIGKALKIYLEEKERLNQPLFDSRVPPDISLLPYVVNYQNRRHVYAYNPTANNIVLIEKSGDFSVTLLPYVWNLIAAPNGTQLLATTGPAPVQVLCTDEVLFSTPPIASVNVANTYATWTGTATATGAGLAVSLTMPAVAGKTAILFGFTISASGGLNAAWGQVTLTDGTNTMNYQYAQTNGGNGSDMFHGPLPPGLKASAPNTSFDLSVPAIATGGVVTLSLWGTYE